MSIFPLRNPPVDLTLWHEKFHDEVMKWKCFLYYWCFMKRNHLSLVDSLHKGPVMHSILCFFWCQAKHTIGQTVKFPVIWDVMSLMCTVKLQDDFFLTFKLCRIFFMLYEVSCCCLTGSYLLTHWPLKKWQKLFRWNCQLHFFVLWSCWFQFCKGLLKFTKSQHWIR